MSQKSSLSRRAFLGASTSSFLLANFLSPQNAHAQTATSFDKRLSPRIIGNPNAKILVQEWFSLTCTHCAHFATEEFPKIREKLIDTGKIRYQFNDLPLDKIGLLAAMIARSLPEERYEPFINSLFSRQMQWAFSDGNVLEHLRQESALAGVSPKQFDSIMNDHEFMKALGEKAEQDSKKYSIEGTPYFRFNEVVYKADPETFEKFSELVAQAS